MVEKVISTAKPTILIVDDSPDILTLVCALLRGIYNVKIANNGKTALKILESGLRPDLILLDIMMPVMDGYATLASLHQSEATSSIPVIMLTAEGYTMNKMLAFNMGASEYVTKPIDSQLLLSKIREVLSK